MSNKIKVTLDGVELSASPKEMIWELAKRSVTQIPHLCHSDKSGYQPDGNCRACMVEVEGDRAPVASCI